MDREDAGDALDHHLAHVGGRLPDERDAAGRRAGAVVDAERQPSYPLGAGAGLAGPAAAEDQPGPPVAVRRELVVACKERPPGGERIERGRPEPGEERLTPAWRQ